MAINTLQLKTVTPDATGDDMNKYISLGVNRIFRDVAEGTQQVEGGGWEILSHSLTKLDNHLVVSFLLSRGK
jgi:hypothetical protein